MAFTLRPRGAFSLAAAASFAEGFPGTDAQHAHNELQFAWPVDEDWRTVAVALRQSGEGVVRGDLAGTPPSGLARRARRARGEVEQILRPNPSRTRNPLSHHTRAQRSAGLSVPKSIAQRDALRVHSPLTALTGAVAL